MNERIDSITTEQNIIACILKKPRIIYDVTAKLNKEYFEDSEGRNHNRAIFAILCYLSQEKDIEELEFDSMTLYSVAKNFSNVIQVINKVFGEGKEFIKYIEMLRQLPINVKNVSLHIDELIKINLANDMLEHNKNYSEQLVQNYGSWNISEIVNKAESGILKLSNSYVSTNADEPQLIGDGIDDDYLNRTYNPNGFVGLPTPFDTLNKFTSGVLRGGSVTVINANSGVGKSLILKQITKYIGVDLGKPVYLGANEQTKQEQKDRLLSEITGVPITILENALYNCPEDTFEFRGKAVKTKLIRERVIEGLEILKKAPIFIDQIQGYNKEALIQRAKYFHTRHNIEAFVWDYVKESAGLPQNIQLRLALQNIVLAMKENIADPLNIPVFTACQAKTYEYWLSAESYGIEKYCTAFLLLRELSEKEKQSNPLGGDYALTVKKNRYGQEHSNYEKQWISLDMDKQYLKFKEVA